MTCPTPLPGSVRADISQFLIDHALALVANGRLPLRASRTVEAGHGSNEACSLCGQSIESSQVRYEVSDPQWRRPQGLCFHLPCFQAYETATRGSGPPGRLGSGVLEGSFPR